MFWAAGINDGSSGYRCGLPAAGLRELGHDATASTLLSPGNIYGRDLPDVLIAQRLCLAEPSALFRRLSDKVPTFVEWDDDLLSVPRSNIPAFRVYSRPDIQINLRANLQAAAGVIVSTQTLADRVSEYNPNVFVIPNYIPEVWLEENNDLTEPVVGWSGSDSHRPDWASGTGRGIANFLKKFPEIPYHSGGSDFRDLAGRPGSEFWNWTLDMNDYFKKLDWSVGVVPLRDSHFNAAKSWIKPLELHAKGVPSICSNAGPYRDYIEDGVDGFLVESPNETFKALKALTSDPDLRAKMGAAGKAKASKLTVEANVHQYLDAFAQVL